MPCGHWAIAPLGGGTWLLEWDKVPVDLHLPYQPAQLIADGIAAIC